MFILHANMLSWWVLLLHFWLQENIKVYCNNRNTHGNNDWTEQVFCWRRTSRTWLIAWFKGLLPYRPHWNAVFPHQIQHEGISCLAAQRRTSKQGGVDPIRRRRKYSVAQHVLLDSTQLQSRQAAPSSFPSLNHKRSATLEVLMSGGKK